MPKSVSKTKAVSPSAPPMQGASPQVVIQPMVEPPPQAGDELTRGGASSKRPGRAGQIVSAANRWRENYNPLRRLDMRRVVELLELGQRGDYAYLQWAYRFAERRNPILSGLLSRCEAPLAQFDWSVKTKATPPPGMSPAVFKEKAAAQKASLEDAYNGIDNLRKAILHLHKADFRGYGHLQKHRTPDGEVYHLEILDQWCICRDGINGNWFWNPDSRSTSMPLQFLGEDYCIGGPTLPLADFIIRECERPINEIGLVDTVRRGLVDKDWDGFIEIYGIPGGVVEMPANVPPGKESEYETAAKQVAEGGSGAMPNGSKYYANDGPRNVDPFTPRLKNLDEALVLAGTGGKLTMMTESSAGGGGQMRGSSKVHDKTFGEIANGRAGDISEVFQRQFDAETLNRTHSGEPHLVYFFFGAEEEEDVDSLVTNVASLKTAGYQTDTEWLAEKTGYVITDAPEPEDENEEEEENPLPGSSPKSRAKNPRPGKVANRAPAADATDFARTISDVLMPLLKRLAAIEKIDDAGVQQHMLEKLLKDYPQISDAILADNSLAQQLSPLLQQNLEAGMTGKVKNRGGKVFNGGPGSGNFGHAGRPGARGGSYPRAPKRITAGEADKMLEAGVTQTDREGRTIKFGQRMKQHFEDDHTPEEAIRRKEHLPHAIETVRTGTRVEIPDPKTGEVRAYYGKYFSDEGKEKGFLSIVDTKGNEAFTAFRSQRDYIERKGIKNRAENESGEQPPLAVLQAMAAAGGLPDWFNINPNPGTVNA